MIIDISSTFALRLYCLKKLKTVYDGKDENSINRNYLSIDSYKSPIIKKHKEYDADCHQGYYTANISAVLSTVNCGVTFPTVIWQY